MHLKRYAEMFYLNGAVIVTTVDYITVPFSDRSLWH